MSYRRGIERSVEFCLRKGRGTNSVYILLLRGGRKVSAKGGKEESATNISLCCGGICLRKYRLDRGGWSNGWKQGECACKGMEGKEEEDRSESEARGDHPRVR